MSGVDFNTVVVDNGSRDGSVEFLRRSFKNIEVIANEHNVGFAAGANIGMRRALDAGAEFVLLVNNDTIVDPNLLRELVSEADAQADVGMVSPKIYYFEPSNLIWWAGGTYSLWTGLADHLGRKNKDGEGFDRALDIDWATGCVLLLRCSALRQLGIFDERMFGNCEDLDLSLRFRKAGYRVRYLPTAKLWHKEGVDYRKNVGEHVRTFTQVRNQLWVMHKHARLRNWMTFWPVFGFYYLPKMVFVSLRRRDFRSCYALGQAVVAFWEMRLHPDATLFPKEFRSAALGVGVGDRSGANAQLAKDPQL